MRGKEHRLSGRLRVLATAMMALALAISLTCWNSIAYAASGPSINVTRAATGIVTIKNGTTYNLGVKATSGSKVTCKSSNAAIVKSMGGGKVKGAKTGKATITITATKGSQKTTKKVTVNVVTSSKYKPVKSITPKATKSSIQAGASTTIKTTFNPSAASNKNLLYSSSNTGVLTVSATGTVRGVKPGTAKVTVTSADNSKAKKTVTVKVTKVPVTSIAASASATTIEMGKTATIKVTISPNNATNKGVAYKSSNTAVLTVDSTGKAKGVKPGTAKVTVTSADNVKATKTLTFKVVVNPTSVKLDTTSVSLGVGESAQLSATVVPSDATNKALTWSSDNAKVATVADGKVTGVAVGEAKITAKAANGKSASCVVTVGITETQSFDDFAVAASALIKDSGVTPSSAAAADDEYFTARLLLKDDGTDIDFSPYGPTAVVKGDDRINVVQFESSKKARSAMSELANNSHVVWVEPDAYMGSDEVTTEADAEATTHYSWGVEKIGADKLAASLKSKGGTVVVGVVDTGVSNHTLLGGRILSGGYDFVDNDRDPSDKHCHGTHVAGTIVDCTPELNVKILPERVLNANGSGSSSWVGMGIKHAANNGANVINLSLGGGHSNYIDDAVGYAVGKGVTVVVAAGNDYSDDTANYCPAHITKCIVVGAVDSNNKKASFSNIGKSVDVVAPGVGIVSSVPGGSYKSLNGTSMATPHVAASAAMVKLLYPSYSPSQIEQTIKNCSTDLGDAGWDKYYGYGIPNLTKLVYVAPTGVTVSPTSAAVEVGKTTKLTATVSPSNATDKTVTWTTSNSSVATVSGGTVTGKAAGTATITAKTTNGKTATCSVTVKEDDNWEGYIKIYDAVGLDGIRNNLSAKYVLMNDIDLSGINWNPIGIVYCNSSQGGYYQSGYSFTGTIDGNGHSINNLYIGQTVETLDAGYSGGHYGFVANASDGAVFKNLNFKNAFIDITTKYDAETVVGTICAYTWSTGATFDNCTIDTHMNVKVAYASGMCVGGICGSVSYASGGSFENCVVDGSISTTSYGYSYDVGGICGEINRSFGSGRIDLRNCTNNSSISADLVYDTSMRKYLIYDGSVWGINIGGLVGRAVGGVITIESCLNAGPITGTIHNVSIPTYVSSWLALGGIAGSTHDGTSGEINIVSCTNSGILSHTVDDETKCKIYRSTDLVGSPRGAGSYSVESMESSQVDSVLETQSFDGALDEVDDANTLIQPIAEGLEDGNLVEETVDVEGNSGMITTEDDAPLDSSGTDEDSITEQNSLEEIDQDE